MPAAWRSRCPAHISPSCSVAPQISAYSRPRAPPGPAVPLPLLLAPTEPQSRGRKAASEARGPSPARFAYFLLAPERAVSRGK